MDDGKPPPRAGNVFVAVHGGKASPGPANQRNLYEMFEFCVTLTMRVTIPLDRVGDQLIARNISLVPSGQRRGFNGRIEQLRAFLHMNWSRTVLTNQRPNSANDNLVEWATGSTQVYGFVKPASWGGAEVPMLVGAEWLGADPESEDFAIKSEMRFTGAERFQPQTSSIGVFV